MNNLIKKVFKINILLMVAVSIPLSSFSQGGGRLIHNLSGEDWEIISADPGQGRKEGFSGNDYSFNQAIPAKVPGDIHWDLERANKIGYLYYGMNTKDARWVTGKEWWYKKTFTIGKEWKGKTVRLCFDAVDYLAEVWLNGHYLGRHEGQFTPFAFDVTGKIIFGNQNILKVLIHRVPEPVREKIAAEAGEWDVMGAMRPAYPYWKSMTSSGWDWGADLISMGIWQDVRLVASDNIYISGLTVLPNLPSPYNKATLNILTNLHASAKKTIKINYQVKCITEEDAGVTVSNIASIGKGEQSVKGVVELHNPQLWWPNGYGKQNLYELTVSVTDAVKNSPLDQTSVTFGIRDLKMLPNPESPLNNRFMDYNPDFAPGRVVDMTDSISQPDYLIQINGRRIMGMGANWIPSDLLFGRPDYDFYQNLIKLAGRANVNLFRIWGGGILEKQMFFDLCDRYGIMLFAEFPNGGVRLPETDEGLKITATEIRQLLPLMINHPCVVRYGGGNEWYIHTQNSRQMAQMRKICNEVDPTRPFHDPDPETVAQRHGPHSFVYETHYQTFNTGYPLTAGPEDPVEWTEYGAAGASSVATLKRIMPEENLFPIKASDPYWSWHKAQNAYGGDNWLGSQQYLYFFGELPDLETTVQCSQFVQAEGLRYANESMRRNQWHRSAFASWTYNEPWPNAAHGCLVEYFGQPKMAYYYARKSCAPIGVSCVYSNLECSPEKPLDLEVWVSNNNAVPVPDAKLRWRIFNTHGTKCFEEVIPVTVPSEQSAIVGKIRWRPTDQADGDVALVFVELIDQPGNAVADNLYTFGIKKTSAEKSVNSSSTPLLKALLQASPADIIIRSVNLDENSKGKVDGLIEIENTGNNAALFTGLNTTLPDHVRVYYSDNYFFLPPGQKRRIGVNLTSDDQALSSGSIEFSVKAWNSALKSLKVHAK